MLLGSPQNPAGLRNALTGLNDPIRQQGVQNTVTGMAANQARLDQSQDYSQHIQQFDNFLGDANVQRLLNPSGSTSSSSSISGAGPGVGGYGYGTAGTWTPQPVSVPQVPAPTSASSAAFARAKGTVANSLSGLMKSVRDQYAGRNLSGGTGEMNAMGNILLKGNQQLADTAQANAVNEAGIANDFAKMGYQGAITQRGQDIGALDSARAAALTARQQDLEQSRFSQSQSQSQAQNGLAALMGLTNLFKTLY